jgi:sulfur carrier protein
MRIRLNGDDVLVEDGASIEWVIERHAGSTRGSAVVVDGEVVPRSVWAQRLLYDGAVVELITAVQGG